MQDHSTRIALTRAIFVTMGLLVLSVQQAAKAAGTDTSEAEAYTWSAELDTFDATAGTITVKSLVVNHAGIENLEELSEGDRAMLTWSGVFSASGIRSLTRGTESEFDRFTLPVEFVSAEMDGRYIRFKVPVPSSDRAKIAALEPGQWVTVTSPHQPSGWNEAVAAIRPYNDVS